MKECFIKDIRAFNRFYTNIIGLVDRHILGSNYSLPEVRIMYELYYQNGLSASQIIVLIDIDKSYLSRIIKRFEKSKLLHKVVSAADRRSARLELTAKGKKEFEVLDTASGKEIAQVFGKLSKSDCALLVQHFKEIQQILDTNNKTTNQ